MRALALEASGGSNVAGPAIRAQGEVRAQSSEYGGGSAGYHSGLWDPRETSAQDCSPTSPDLGVFRSMLPLPIDRMGRGVVCGASEMTLQAILASSAGDARRQTRMESCSSRSWEGALGDASAALTHPGTGASTANRLVDRLALEFPGLDDAELPSNLAGRGHVERMQEGADSRNTDHESVSYTHLTLPTILRL